VVIAGVARRGVPCRGPRARILNLARVSTNDETKRANRIDESGSIRFLAILLFGYGACAARAQPSIRQSALSVVASRQ